MEEISECKVMICGILGYLVMEPFMEKSSVLVRKCFFDFMHWNLLQPLDHY